MGITSFNDFVKEVRPYISNNIFQRTTLKDLSPGVIILDANALLIRFGRSPTIKDSGDDLPTNIMLMMIRLIKDLQDKHTVIMVTDFSKIQSTALEDAIKVRIKSFNETHAHIAAKPLSKSGEELIVIEDFVTASDVAHAKDKTRAQRELARITIQTSTGVEIYKPSKEMISALESVCAALKVKFHYCALEADGLMAGLAQKYRKKHENVYMLTEDTDLFIYPSDGAKIVRRCSVDGRLKGDEYEVVNVEAFWREVGITDQSLRYRIPLLMKCDYFTRISRIGPKTLLRHLFLNWTSFKNTQLGPDNAQVIKLIGLMRRFGANANPDKISDFVDIDDEEYRKEIHKLGYSPQLLERYTFEDLICMRDSSKTIQRPAFDIDLYYSAQLGEASFREYVNALCRFTDGIRLEMNYANESPTKSKVAKDELHDLMVAAKISSRLMAFLFDP